VADSRVRVGLVGTGVIAQVMHLHYLAELADRFEMAAVCDLDGEGARAVAERYGIPAVYTDWREMLARPLDAVMVLTSGSHAPIAEAAARAGRHVFVEKPMCYSAAEGRAMVAAAEAASVILMVGYPKRYDPAFLRMREETARLDGARLLRVTTFESPFRPYVGHYPLLPRVPLPAEVAAGLRKDSDERIEAAVGAAVGADSVATDLERQVYETVLLDTLVHELNTVRGLLGEPTRLEYASLAPDLVTVMLRFGHLSAAIHWIDLPGIARYAMEFALYAPERRLSLTFPSPFLRNAPAVLEVEGGSGGAGRSWRTEEIAGYDSGFKAELVAFHDSIVTGCPPATSGQDGLRDVALCQAIIDSHHRSTPVDYPSATGVPEGSGETTGVPERSGETTGVPEGSGETTGVPEGSGETEFPQERSTG
jgi:predicted dehydrogenase